MKTVEEIKEKIKFLEENNEAFQGQLKVKDSKESRTDEDLFFYKRTMNAIHDNKITIAALEWILK